MNIHLKKIKLYLNVNWKIARSESVFKENFILSMGQFESEIAPNIRYGETIERIEKEFSELKSLDNISVMDHWCNSFKNAVNNLDLKIKSNGDITNFLGLEQVNYALSSFSIPIMNLGDVSDYISINNNYEFYKIKVRNFKDINLVKEVSKSTSAKLRIDANEGFTSLKEYLIFEKAISDFNIEFIEQPFKSSMLQEYQELKRISKFEIIADESIEDGFDPVNISKQFHGVNIKLMKSGGIENSFKLIQLAKKHNLKIMLGCMIESSLGISEALYLANYADYVDLDGALLLEKDPYSHLLSYDRSKIKACF